MQKAFTGMLVFLLAFGLFACAAEPVPHSPTTTEAAKTFPLEISQEIFPEPLLWAQAIHADTDGDGFLTEAEAQAVKSIRLTKFPEGIGDEEDTGRPTYTKEDFTLDLEGIQYFTQLTELRIDMQGGECFVSLETEQILATTKHFESIYACTALEKLCLCEMDVTELDLSAFPALTRLELNSMYKLESVRFSVPSKLDTLWISECHALPKLDLTPATQLKTLDIVGSQGLGQLLLSSAIETIQLNELPSLKQIDLSTLSELKKLDLMYVALTQLDVGSNPKLTDFSADGLHLDVLDLRSNPNISYIINAHDSFRSILLADNNRVTMVRWTDSEITEFPFTNLNPKTLVGIDIQGTAIKKLNVRPYPKLEYLYYDKDITKIKK